MPTSSQLATPIDDMDHTLGPAHAAITLVEYGDYECPYTGEALELMDEVRSRFPDHLRLVFRHYPLTSKHPRAWTAGEAAEAAGAQARFWEMHRRLLVGQPRLGDEDLRDYARQLYLNMIQFQAALVQRTYADRVKRDALSGERSGVDGTPTYFINGTRHHGPDDLTGLVSAIEKLLGHKVPG